MLTGDNLQTAYAIAKEAGICQNEDECINASHLTKEDVSKNTNKYIVKQNCTENERMQEVLEPENIKGVKITYKDNTLSVENTSLDLKKIYQDYPYIQENVMFLTDFIAQYKECKVNGNTNVEKEDDNIIYTIKFEEKYKQTQQLYVSEKTGNPVKMIVQDNNQKAIVYILYNEIKLNNN